MNKHDPDLLKKWKDFDEVYFDFQNKLHTFWTAIDVGESRSFFADLYTDMHRMRPQMAQMLPNELKKTRDDQASIEVSDAT